jgi:hypothetical protein
MTRCPGKSATATTTEIETTLRLWIAANDAKDARIQELEQETARLRQRVARLASLLERQRREAAPRSVESVARRLRQWEGGGANGG